MAEYYSKEQLLKSGRTTWCDMYDLEDFLDEIPAENVLQITRCKDCEYYNEGFCYNSQWFDGDTSIIVKETDFCSYGTPQNDEVRE